MHSLLQVVSQIMYIPQLFHSICRIAEVLINLQQVGNVKYTGWILQVPCHINPQDPNDTSIISELQDQAKIMENELSEWKEMVKEKRRDFYELNYFSTLQLLTLRKELGTIKNFSRAVISPNVIVLLQSISSQITSGLVCDIVHGVASVPTEGMKTEDIIENDVPHQSFNAVPLMDEIIASADKQTSATNTISHDSPNLTENDLSLEERGIMDSTIQKLKYHKLLILTALETYRCKGGKWDKYDIQIWCQNNEDNFVFDDDEEGDFADEEESEGEGSYSGDSDSVRSDEDSQERKEYYKNDLKYVNGPCCLLCRYS